MDAFGIVIDVAEDDPFPKVVAVSGRRNSLGTRNVIAVFVRH